MPVALGWHVPGPGLLALMALLVSCVGMGAASWQCVTDCLSQVSLAPRDTSLPRCSGRIPMAKLWTCGLVVSQTGAEMPGEGWDGCVG